jgi:hypothetical protein
MSKESTATPVSRVSTRAVAATFGLFVSVLFWLVVATYPTFFFINPFAEEDKFRAALLAVSTVGWIALSTGPVVLFTLYALGYARALMFLPVVALIWPASLLVNHVSLFIQRGSWFTGYLLDYPIFIATDILMPILLLAIWSELRPAIHHHPIHSAAEK